MWRERGSTLRFLKRRFDQPQERLLAGLGQAARLCPPIEASLSEPRPEASALTAAEAHTFIREEALGFGSTHFALSVAMDAGAAMAATSAAAARHR